MQENGLARSPMGAVMIAGLALLTSAVAALAVLFGLRRLLVRPSTSNEDGARSSAGTLQPAVDAQMAAEMPEHFSEDLVIPGFTQTGMDIETQDAQSGRSAEGV